MSSLLKKFKLNIFYQIFIVLISISPLFFLAACATDGDKKKPKKVSLEEAKMITAQFESEPFTPPPRTINDINTILSQDRPDDFQSFSRALVIADSQPPDTTNDKKLAEFYFKRARAAHEVGRAKQEIEDYRKSVSYGEKSYFKCYHRALGGLSAALVRGGNWSEGIRTGEKVLTVVKEPFWLANWYSVLCWMYAKIGDIESAQKALQKAEYFRIQENKRVPRSSRAYPTRWLDMRDSTIASGWAAYLDATGKLTEAQVKHLKAVRLWEPYLKSPVWSCGEPKARPRLYHWMVSNFAVNLSRQGHFIRAEIQARKAVNGALKSHGRYSAHTAMMISRLNKVIFEQGRFREAEVLAKTNLNIHERTQTAKDSVTRADARSVLADALLAQKKWQDALSEYDRIREDLKHDRSAYDGFFSKARINLWLALIKGRRSAEALPLIRSALDRKIDLLGKEEYDTAETQGIFGMALAASGRYESALDEFTGAIPILFDHYNRADSGSESLTARDFRFVLILESYIQLLGRIHGTELEKKSGLNAAAESFWLADVIKGRSIKRALAASSARAAAKNPELANLARREQDTLMQIGALNDLLINVLSAPENEQNPKAVKDLQGRINQLRSARAALKKEIETRFPNYADLVDPKPVSVEEIQSILEPGEVLIATFVGDNGSLVWAIPHQGTMVFSSTKLDRNRITEMVKSIRASLGPPSGGTLGDIPDFDIETGYHLYEALLKPVEAGWKNAKVIIVVPHGSLGFLPISVLPTKAVKLGPEKEPLFSNHRTIPWLARTHAVSALPSAASLRTLRSLPTGDTNRRSFTGFGSPYFNLAQVSIKEEEPKIASVEVTRGMPLKRRGLKVMSDYKKEPDSADLSSLPHLPDTADELRNIALALKADPMRDVYLGKLASEDRVKSINLSDVKVLAFATHGLLPGELDGLSQPALALSSPKVTGGVEDGLLTMGEILSLKLDSDWVVLSACNTAAGEGAGAEAISGLGRAFFYAGTRALLVSNWAVETSSAKTLTTELFRRHSTDPNLSRSEALNQTMVDMIDRLGFTNAEGKVVFSYAHPVFWAPFSLIGDGAL